MSAVFAMTFAPGWLPVLIFSCRVIDVSLGTMRMICLMRGQKAISVTLGFFETLFWTLAVSQVIQHLDHWVNILAFAGGFTTGNAVGIWIEQRLALGYQRVSMITRIGGLEIASRLATNGITVTSILGTDDAGPVEVFTAIVPRKQTARVVETAKEFDSGIAISIEDVAHAIAGVRPNATRRLQSLLMPRSSLSPREAPLIDRQAAAA